MLPRRTTAVEPPDRQRLAADFGCAQNQFDSIDLSDNAIVRLEGFPKLHRLRWLHLNNNRINRVARHLEGAPPPAPPAFSESIAMLHHLHNCSTSMHALQRPSPTWSG